MYSTGKISVQQITAIVLFLLLIFFISGCEEDFTPYKSVIDGKVHYRTGAPAIGMQVFSGKPPTEWVDFDGNFHIENASNPYNLIIKSPAKFSNEIPFRTAYYFDNITVDKPNFIIGDDEYFSNRYTEYLEVSYPLIDSGKYAYLILIGNDFTYNYPVILYSGTSFQIVRIEYNKFPLSIEKVCFTEFTGSYYSNNIFSIDKIGVKDFDLNEPVIFNDADIQFNPSEIYTHCKIEAAEGNVYSHNAVYIAFKNYSQEAKFLIYGNNASNLEFYVPDSLPLPFKVQIESYCSSLSEGYHYKTFHIDPGEYKEFRYSPGLSVRSPNNEIINVNGSTEFSFFSPAAKNSINLFSLDYYKDTSSTHFSYFTKSTSLKLNDFINAGFVPIKNARYSWYVKQFLDFETMDDFLRSDYINNENYTERIYSKTRYFTTAP